MMTLTCRFDVIPPRMKNRPIDHRGFPVPWFVSEKTPDGFWDFVNIDPERLKQARQKRLCTLSGEPLGKFVAFVVGPMCIINRVSAEPPCIPELAKWAAQVCPFLSRPLAKRPNIDPECKARVPGLMVEDNPGGCVVWVVKRSDFEYGRDGLYRFGNPVDVTFWTKGRQATPLEAVTIYDNRAAKLRDLAAEEGFEALLHYNTLKARADQYLPVADSLS